LHLACSKGYKETEKLLLSYGADANELTKDGWTPLHIAAHEPTDCPEVCEILLKSGAKIDAITTYLDQPLHLACSKGHKETDLPWIRIGCNHCM
jgi:ankyrin